MVPTSSDHTELTPEGLRDLLLNLRTELDRIEHVKVIERAGLLWIGAYVSVAQQRTAQQSLHRLCDRLAGVIKGWDPFLEPDWLL